MFSVLRKGYYSKQHTWNKTKDINTVRLSEGMAYWTTTTTTTTITIITTTTTTTVSTTYSLVTLHYPLHQPPQPLTEEMDPRIIGRKLTQQNSTGSKLECVLSGAVTVMQLYIKLFWSRLSALIFPSFFPANLGNRAFLAEKNENNKYPTIILPFGVRKIANVEKAENLDLWVYFQSY